MTIMEDTLSHPKVDLLRDALVELSHNGHRYLLLWPEVGSQTFFVTKTRVYILLEVWYSEH